MNSSSFPVLFIALTDELDSKGIIYRRKMNGTGDWSIILIITYSNDTTRSVIWEAVRRD